LKKDGVISSFKDLGGACSIADFFYHYGVQLDRTNGVQLKAILSKGYKRLFKLRVEYDWHTGLKDEEMFICYLSP
jgi:hypothetical protein